MHYDVFNGDADGIISLLQLRLAEPRDSQLITGVKRNIQLLNDLSVGAGDSLTVLDISLQKNHAGLLQALEAGATVFYADHHQAGDVPVNTRLEAHIDLDANTCTALIINQLLHQRYNTWAITAAYGDNLIAVANSLAVDAGLTKEQAGQLRELGTLINYNGYGKSVEQLHFHPASLYQALVAYPSPFDVIADRHSPFYALKAAYDSDISAANALPAYYESEVLRVFELPDKAFAHRVSGVYGNLLANQSPSQAHLVLTSTDCGDYTVSLRAPLHNKQGADKLCSLFATGGGREAAAGINQLSKDDLAKLIAEVENYYQPRAL